MELIDYDVQDRKSLARASKHKKNGSKSKKCMLPSDRLTDAQLRKKNGGLMVYQTGRPISWKEFKEYPTEMQKEYLEHFAQKHGCNNEMMADMMGVKHATLYTYTHRKGLGGIVSRQPSYETRKAFDEWLESQRGPVQPAEEVKEPTAPAEKPVKEDKPVRTKATIVSGSCKLEGPANEILLELQQMLKNEKICMFVSWQRMEEK